jgi:hypothetical protein
MNAKEFAKRILTFLDESAELPPENVHRDLQAMVEVENLDFKELVKIYDLVSLDLHQSGKRESLQLVASWWAVVNPFGKSPVVACLEKMSLEEQFEMIDWFMRSQPWHFASGKLHILISNLKLDPKSPARPLIEPEYVALPNLAVVTRQVTMGSLRPYMLTYLKAIRALA